MTQPPGCMACASPEVSVFFEMPAVPVYCNLLWPTREAAEQTPRGDLVLGFCRNCGLIYNLAFDPQRLDYSQAYENSLHFSPHFQAYAHDLAARLIAAYALRGKNIIEIGCGTGEFLSLLCELGGNRGIGFDPSEVNRYSVSKTTENITFIRDFYSERYADLPADFICCRHVLEHIRYPQPFLKAVRRAIGDRRHTAVFFEVPNVLFTLRDRGIWDIIYEHCSYFSAPSLSHLFAKCGFKAHALAEAYAGQFLCIEARPAESGEEISALRKENLKPIAQYVAQFAATYKRQVAAWKQKFEQIQRAGKRAVIWGAGSKGVTFLNTLQIQNQMEYVVDVNPRKQGMFVAGTGQQIVAPEILRRYRPDIVIVMNPIYAEEIRQNLLAMEVGAEVILV